MNEFSSWNRWRDHLNALGVGEIVDELFRPGSPLAIIAAQLLYVARPSLSAFADDPSLASLTRFTNYLESEDLTLHTFDVNHRRVAENAEQTIKKLCELCVSAVKKFAALVKRSPTRD